MRSFMGFQAKRELLLQTMTRYCEAESGVKPGILDEFVSATGYHRKYAIGLLNGPLLTPPAAIKRPRDPKYGPTIVEALVLCWTAANCICAKRLVPFLPELVPLLEHHGHLAMDDHRRALILSVSAATADRLLRTSRPDRAGGLSTTKPGALLKQHIPIRTFTEWEDTRVGFFEVDLVAHCGTTIAGTFLWTLVMTDVASGWTECLALLRRSGQTVVQAIRDIEEDLPFPILGIDTDNGSEFINAEMVDFCKEKQFTFTRGRAYRKNDQCFVEQKNGSIVRQVVGYDRYDGQEALRQLNELYKNLRLYINFYQPSMKLKTKTRDGGKAHRTYSPAQTPLQRVLATDVLAPPAREELKQLRWALDPVVLLGLIRAQQDAFWKFAYVTPTTWTKVTLPTVCNEESPPPAAVKAPAVPEIQARKYRQAGKPRKKRECLFDSVDAILHNWVLASPETSCKGLLRKLQLRYPGAYPDSNLRLLQQKVSKWRLAAGIRPPVGSTCWIRNADNSQPEECLARSGPGMIGEACSPDVQ